MTKMHMLTPKNQICIEKIKVNVHLLGFSNYHNTGAHDHVGVPKFRHTWYMWINTKSHVSDTSPLT